MPRADQSSQRTATSRRGSQRRSAPAVQNSNNEVCGRTDRQTRSKKNGRVTTNYNTPCTHIMGGFQTDKDGSSSVVAAVLGEATFGRLCKGGVRLLGRRYEVDAFEEAWRPDAFCSRCSGWKHIAPHCLAAAPRCALCAKDRLTTDHRCPAAGCRVGKGHPCPHGKAKRANCGGSHGARADVCAAKRETRLSARGWRSLPPPRRERRERGAVESPEVESPEVQIPVAQGRREWVERRSRRGSSPARKRWRSRGAGGGD